MGFMIELDKHRDDYFEYGEDNWWHLADSPFATSRIESTRPKTGWEYSLAFHARARLDSALFAHLIFIYAAICSVRHKEFFPACS